MSTTAANYADLAKEVWDSDTMVKQFYDENPWLDMIEKKQRVVIGKRAQVPLHTGRAGGTTVLDSAGGFINDADSEDVDRAEYTLSYNYFPVSIEVGALNEITGGAQSVGDALEHMMSSGISNMRNHVTRQFLTGHGRVAAVDTDGGGDAVVPLATLADVAAGEVSGADALLAGWIVPGDVVEIGTTADYDAIVDRGTSQTPAAISVVSAIDDDPDAPTITLGANVGATTLGTHYVSLANAKGAAGTGSLVESAGLVTIAGTRDNTVGNIDASSNGFWNPAEVDSTTTVPDMELLLRLTRKVRRRGGDGAFILTSLLQLDNVYQMLQSQVRFNGDREIGAGGSEQFKWRGNTLHAFPQVPENFMFFVDMESLEIVVGKYTKPTWLSDLHGSGMLRDPRQTVFEDTVMVAQGLACKRRNGMAGATNLSATV
jgi:hypothetical protein